MSDTHDVLRCGRRYLPREKWRTSYGGRAGRLDRCVGWADQRFGERTAWLGRRLWEGRRAYVACDGGSVVTLDTATGSELASVPIAGVPDAIWHNHQRGRLSVATRDPGVIEVVNTTTMTVEQQIFTERGAHTTAFDALRQRLFVFLPALPHRTSRCTKRARCVNQPFFLPF